MTNALDRVIEKLDPQSGDRFPNIHTCNKTTGAPENKTILLLHSDNMQLCKYMDKIIFKLNKENKK